MALKSLAGKMGPTLLRQKRRWRRHSLMARTVARLGPCCGGSGRGIFPRCATTNSRRSGYQDIWMVA